jgi:hypothetical protein
MMGLLNYLTVEIFPVIVRDLQERGVEISIEELITMVMQPKSSSNKCMYQYKRGENKGQLCGKPVAEGTNYCSNCLKTRKNLGLDSHNSIEERDLLVNNSLTVVVHDESRHLYRDPNTNFIIYQTASRPPTAIGQLVNNKIHPLTDPQIQMATELGLLIYNLSSNPTPSPSISLLKNPIQKVPLPLIPSVPSVPTVHAVPSVPTVPAVPSVPTVPAVPAVPAVPSVPAMHLGSMMEKVPPIPSMPRSLINNGGKK